VYRPQVHTIPLSLWDQSNTPIFLESSDAFYQYLLGPPQKLAFNKAQIAVAISAGTLLACSDGSFNPRSGTGSHGWVMATPNREVLLTGAGQMSGNPRISSQYRAELSSLVATLYLIHRICSHHGVEHGQCQLYCDNNGAIRNVFHCTFSGISQFTKSDYDLIQAAKHLLKVIQIEVKLHWVKGHSQAPKKTVQEEMNITADELAGHYAICLDPSFPPNSYQIARPNYKIRLRYQNMVVTSKLYETLQTSLHSRPLCLHIMKKANISERVFDLINWEAFGTSFRRFTRNRKIHISKLVHQLLNTNKQNNMYYGSSSLCPCCQVEIETFSHVFKCKSPSASHHRTMALESLQKKLKNIHTPENMVIALLHGITQWTTEVPIAQVRALTMESLQASNVVLTSAFAEQYHSIGWLQLLLGRISKKWELAYTHYIKVPSSETYLNAWSTSFIHHIWDYTHSLWANRNAILHGATAEIQAANILRELHSEVTFLYTTLCDNPHQLLPQNLGLIHNRSLDELLKLPYDDIQCWLRLVQEAREVLQHQEEQQRMVAAQYFSNSGLHTLPL